MTDITRPNKETGIGVTAEDWNHAKEAVNSKLDGDSKFEDLREVLSGKNLLGTPGTADYDFTNGWIVLQEGGDIATAGDVVLANFQLPHALKLNTTANLHLHWIQTTETSRTITGKFRIQPNGAVPITAWTDFSATCTAAEDNVFPWAVSGVVQTTSLVAIDLTGFNISDIIQVRIARTDANAADDMYVLYMDMHIEVDTIGSTTEYAK
jgi:hypothetical protein